MKKSAQDRTTGEELSKDGGLLAIARTGCLKDLYEEYLLAGFRGRCSGSRAEENPSPIPGSTIVLGNRKEVVVICQTQRGRGPIEVISYRSSENYSSDLYDEIMTRLKESELPLAERPPD